MSELTGANRLALRLLMGVLVVYPFLKYAIVEPWSVGYEGGDFTIYYRAAEKLAAGESPYPLEALESGNEGEGSAIWGEYPYPPLLARLLIPLTGLEIIWAKRIYVGICLAVLFSILVPFLESRTETEIERWDVAAILLGWAPLIYSIRLGQCELLALPFLALAWRSLSRAPEPDSIEDNGRGEIVGGVCLGIAAMVRVTPILMLPALLVAQRWRLAVWFCIGAVLNLAIAGPVTSFDFFTKVLPSMSDVSGMRHCPAFHVLVLRLVDTLAPTTGSPDWWTARAALFGTLASGLFYSAVLLFLYSKRKTIETENLMLIGLYLAPLFAGKNPHHYALAILPVMAATAILIRGVSSGNRPVFWPFLWVVFLIPSFDYWAPAKFLADRFCAAVSLETVSLDIFGNVGSFLMALILLTQSSRPGRSR